LVKRKSQCNHRKEKAGTSPGKWGGVGGERNATKVKRTLAAKEKIRKYTEGGVKGREGKTVAGRVRVWRLLG